MLFSYVPHTPTLVDTLKIYMFKTKTLKYVCNIDKRTSSETIACVEKIAASVILKLSIFCYEKIAYQLRPPSALVILLGIIMYELYRYSSYLY